MKRLLALTTAVLIIFGLTVFGTAKAAVSPTTSRLMNDAPQAFTAYGFQYIESGGEIPPFHILQAQIEFPFFDKKPIAREFTVEYPSESDYGQAVHILTLNLTYDRDMLIAQESFISGTFTYHWNHNGTVTDYTGTLSGGLVEISTEIMEFNIDYEYTNALALDLAVDGNPWDWTIYLEVLGEELYYMGHMIEDSIEDYSSEETPHVPSPVTQADVAAGVGVSTVGIAVANALTKTTVMGSASFTPPVNMQNASMGNNIAQPVTETSRGFFSSIWRFIKNLLENLRDMLTDEGRSFASGKLSENIGDIGADDISGSDTE